MDFLYVEFFVIYFRIGNGNGCGYMGEKNVQV